MGTNIFHFSDTFCFYDFFLKIFQKINIPIKHFNLPLPYKQK